MILDIIHWGKSPALTHVRRIIYENPTLVNSKPIVNAPVLETSELCTGVIRDDISERLYAAVASILAYVYQLERGMETSLDNIDVPDDLVFDEFGNVVESFGERIDLRLSANPVSLVRLMHLPHRSK